MIITIYFHHHYCHSQISKTILKALGDGFLTHWGSRLANSKWHPSCQSGLSCVFPASPEFSTNKKEASIERDADCVLKPDRSCTQRLNKCDSASSKLLQTKPAEISGFETRLTFIPLIVPYYLHLTLSLLILDFVMRWRQHRLKEARSF